MFPEPKLTVEQASKFLLANPSGKDVFDLIAKAFDGETLPVTTMRMGQVMGWDEDRTIRAIALYACIHIQNLRKELMDLILCTPQPYPIVSKNPIKGILLKDGALSKS
jgi:hypothetical protein